jgi:hypothetical protein
MVWKWLHSILVTKLGIKRMKSPHFDTGDVLGEQKNNEYYKLSDLLDEKNTK